MNPNEMVVPFSNGSEAMDWYSANCSKCVRAYHPKDGNYPSDKTMRQYVSIGKECKMKYDIDFAFMTGTITLETVARIGYSRLSIQGEKNFCDLKDCMMFSDDEDDRFKYPKRPSPDNTPKEQLVMPFIIDEIVSEQIFETLPDQTNLGG